MHKSDHCAAQDNPCVFAAQMKRLLQQLQQRWLLKSPVQVLRTVPTSFDARPCYPREPQLPLPPPLPVPARALWRLDCILLFYFRQFWVAHDLLIWYWLNAYVTLSFREPPPRQQKPFAIEPSGHECPVRATTSQVCVKALQLDKECFFPPFVSFYCLLEHWKPLK